jgi:dGTPase
MGTFDKENIEKNKRKFPIAKSRKPLYERHDEIRSPFIRDYTRIIHCFGFRRLKHKTQVFFHPYNDHVCTRMEHALHVASISSIICKELRLSVELANAISIGHDLGHAPFGHHGESVLNNLWNENIEGIIDPAKKKKLFLARKK